MSELDEPHFAALVERLQESPKLDGKVFDTVRRNPDGTLVTGENYLVLFGGSPVELGQERLHKPQLPGDDAVFDFTVRAVGIDPASVRAISIAAAAQFVGWSPIIPGRYCRPVKFTGGDAPRADASAGVLLYFADDEYELRSFFRNGS